MRQQGANLFENGINLDTNPIGIDNHTMTGALNATMITMNGNEKVLQNDMGNAKVDQALLPEGYVPVGMKEYGGIVYVASYNPLKGESLIGCFPSPQRNLASEDEGLQPESLKSICEFVKDVYYEVTNGNPESGITYYSDDSGETEIDPNESYYQDPSNTGTAILTSYNSLDLSETVYGDASETSEITFYKKENEIIDTEAEIILINDILRSGDKFIVTSTNSFNNLDSNIGANLIKLKVIIKDSEGNGIDITNQLLDYPYNSTDPDPITYEHFRKILNKDNAGTPIDEKYFNVYKNKISGKLYLKEELILPSYINIRISASTVLNAPTERDITFDISAHNEDGTDWVGNNIFDYVLEVKDANGDPVNCSHIQIGRCSNNKQTIKYEGVYEGEELYYTVYPRYNYGCCDLQNQNCKYGRVDKLKRSGYIDVSSIASGEVKFDNGEFRYFNDHVRGKLVLDYSLEAYTDDSGWDLSRIYLETYDIEDLFDANGTFDPSIIERTSPLGTGARKEIDLGISNYFGTFSKGLYYDTTNSSFRDFEEGHYYTVRIVAETINQVDPTNKISYESEWYAVITSTITNSDYFDGVNEMYPILRPYADGKPKIFELDWNTEFSREDVGSTNPVTETITNNRSSSLARYFWQNPNFIDDDIESKFKTHEPNSGTDIMAYLIHKTGDLKYKYKGETTVNTHVSFPFDARFNPDVEIDTPKYSTNPTYIGNSSDSAWEDNLMPTINNDDVPLEIPAQSLNAGRIAYYDKTNNDTLKLHYNLFYQFFAKLGINPDKSSIQDEKEKRRFTEQIETNLFIPYTTFYITDEDVDKVNLEYVFGPVHLKDSVSDYHIRELLPTKWFAYERSGVSAKLDDDYDSASSRYNLHACMINGITPMQLYKGDESSYREEVRYLEKTKKNPVINWTNISSAILRCYEDPPAIIFWYGSRWEATAINSLGQNRYIHETGTSDHGAGYHMEISHPGYHFDTNNTGDYHLYNYVFMLILGNNGEYYVVNLFNPYTNDGYAAGEYDMMYHICKAFNHIYVCLPNQYIDLDYWTNSTDPNDYVYTKTYSIDYSTNVFTKYEKTNSTYTTPLNLYGSHFNAHNQYLTHYWVNRSGLERWYLPKFDLKTNPTTDPTIHKKVCKKTFTDSVQSPDGIIKVVEFLDNTLTPTPTETWALVKDVNGNQIIKRAYTYDSQDKLHITNFLQDRCYMFCGYTNKGDGNTVSYGDISDNPIGGNSEKALLIDINNSDIDLLFKTHVTDPRKITSNCNYSTGVAPIRLGYYPALYVKNKTLVVEFNNDHNYKLLKFNSGKADAYISHAPIGLPVIVREIIGTVETITYFQEWNGEWAGLWLGDLCDWGSKTNYARETLYNLTRGHVIDFEPLYRRKKLTGSERTISSSCPNPYPHFDYGDIYHPEYFNDLATELSNTDLLLWENGDRTGNKGKWSPTFLHYRTLFNSPRYEISAQSVLHI